MSFHRLFRVWFTACLCVSSVTLHAQSMQSGEADQASIQRTGVSQGRIIGGSRVRVGDYPWTVALARTYSGTNTQATFCGGTLIHPKWVLTAAHCVTSSDDRSDVLPTSAFNVLAGNVDVERSESVAVQRVFVHGGYAARGNPDLALLRLEREIDLPVLKLLDNNHPAAGAGALLTTIGWGVTDETNRNTVRYLRQVNVPVIRYADCRDFWGGQINQTAHLCAGVSSGARDSCFGDSGGPLVARLPGTDEFRLVGVVSFGSGCGRANTPAVYARAIAYSTWIQTRIGNQPAPPASDGVQAIASFTTTCDSLVCRFDASGSSAGPIPTKTYLWNFGDGRWDTGATVEHAFGESSSYRVTLHLIDTNGNLEATHDVITPTTSVASLDLVKHDFKGTAGSRQLILLPSSDGFYVSGGEIRARADAVRGTDIEVSLLRRSATTGRWRAVARSKGNGHLEYIRYQAQPGHYMWSVQMQRGRGAFRVRTRHTD